MPTLTDLLAADAAERARERLGLLSSPPLSTGGGMERILSILSILQGAPGSSGAPSGGAPSTTSSGTGGPVLAPNDPHLQTKRGVTLKGRALQSLLDIARRSDLRPGTKELRYITDSYRSPAQQAAAYANKPGLAAPPGTSMHQRGVAIDAGWWSEHPELARALEAAGWNRFDPATEPWHWSWKVSG